MPLSELKKTPTKHDAKDALGNHIKGLYRSIKARDLQIKDLQNQLTRAQMELEEMLEAMALALENLSKFDSETSESSENSETSEISESTSDKIFCCVLNSFLAIVLSQ